MSSIGLYDIDLFHSSRKIPNLELMKVFSYFYEKGDIVVLIGPEDNQMRFNKIFFFKETNAIIPKKLDLAGAEKQIIGYGFYRKAPKLNTEILKCKPNYLPYDLNIEKFSNIKEFESIKKGSYIRLETNDFADFDKSKKHIYLADNNIAKVNGFEDFIREYHRNYYIHFLRTAVVDCEEDFLRLFPYKKGVVINYRFSKELFFKYLNEPVAFAPVPIRETNRDYIARHIKMVLVAKKNNCSLFLKKKKFNQLELERNPCLKLQNLICDWNYSKENTSLWEFLEDKKDLIDITQDDLELRLLSKINPKTYDTLDIDFWNKM